MSVLRFTEVPYYNFEAELARVDPTFKKIKKELICPKHRKGFKYTLYYDESSTYAEIAKCCCDEFTNTVFDVLTKIELVDYVKIYKLE